MYIEGANGVRPIGDGLLEVSEASLNKLIASDDINESYDVEQTPFARGKFATVRRALHKKSGVSFAAKFLRRRRRAQCTLKEIRHEIAILMLCADSEHIVKLHSVHETTVETALILEMANGGELQTLLDESGSLTEPQTMFCMQEVLKALQFLHKKCIAHLDLKPQNILLCGKRVEDGIKLCDFGISRIVEETGSKVREILGTPDYVAPEVLSYEPLSLKTDMWSVGVLAYVLLSGLSPFGGDTKQETFMNISQCNLSFAPEDFEDVSDDAIDFIKSSLQVTADDRMSAPECLEHKWLSDCVQLIKKDAQQTTLAATVATIHCEHITDILESQANSCNNEISNKLRNNEIVTSPLPPLPPKPSAGFFLHQNVNNKNGTNIDELMFSKFGAAQRTTHTNINSDHSSLQSSLPTQQQQQQQHQPLTLSNGGEFSSKDMDCLKPSQVNIVGCSQSDKSDLLKDYAINKENINLSTILMSRTSSSTATGFNDDSSDIGRLSNGTVSPALTLTNLPAINSNVTTANNNNINNNNNNSSSNNNNTTQSTKIESILFPDAPTTPKVSRKSNIDGETDTPTCVTLVKQFQLNGNNLAARIDFDPTSAPDALSTYKPSPTNRSNSKFSVSTSDHTRDTIPSAYRLTATAMTSSSTSNGHHSLASSTLSINTITESSVGGVGSASTVTCLCGAEKSANCCCNSGSRATLAYRKKSLAVVDNSILC